jgi:hypothetical protein
VALMLVGTAIAFFVRETHPRRDDSPVGA